MEGCPGAGELVGFGGTCWNRLEGNLAAESTRMGTGAGTHPALTKLQRFSFSAQAVMGKILPHCLPVGPAQAEDVGQATVMFAQLTERFRGPWVPVPVFLIRLLLSLQAPRC